MLPSAVAADAASASWKDLCYKDKACEEIAKCQFLIPLLLHLLTGSAERLSLLERECLYKLLLITLKREILWMISWWIFQVFPASTRLPYWNLQSLRFLPRL